MPKFSLYISDDNLEKFHEVVHYLQNEGERIQAQSRSLSPTMIVMLEAFHELFVAEGKIINYGERMAQLKNKNVEKGDKDITQLKRQLDKIFYLQLANYHATTKGKNWDIQDLESIHSMLDPDQHELLARIEDVIKEDISRGQTMKHSHK